MSADHTHLVNNGKRDLTIDELAQMQPGLDLLMADVGNRAHRLYYAGQARNWGLAGYFYRSLVKALRLCATSRPKYAEPIERYLEDDCCPVRDAIKACDGPAFDSAYARMIDRANALHGEFGKPWIHWVTPPTPPGEFDFTVGASR